MLGVVMVLGFMFGFMIVLGILEKVAQHKSTDIVEEIRRKEENERRAG